LYLQGLYLDIGTVIVGAITLGIAVDDTIHFLASFRRLIEEGDSAKLAIAKTFTMTVPALIVTTLVLVASFGTFILGDFVPNQSFGKMVAGILTFALVADLVLLPALLLAVGEKFFLSKKKGIN
jgi:predicted RND superfamily exporter protein